MANQLSNTEILIVEYEATIKADLNEIAIDEDFIRRNRDNPELIPPDIYTNIARLTSKVESQRIRVNQLKNELYAVDPTNPLLIGFTPDQTSSNEPTTRNETTEDPAIAQTSATSGFPDIIEISGGVSENSVLDDQSIAGSTTNSISTSAPVIAISGGADLGDKFPNKRQYNPLSKFSSSTYRISLYALSADSYNSYFVNGKWILKDLDLLIQSAGAPANSPNNPRNQFFDLDFYIDNLEITTATNGKDTRVASNMTLIRFQIFEPYAMSFPSRLVAAQEVAQKKSKIKRPVTDQSMALLCPYLLVLRFYGYDNQGNVVSKPFDMPDTADYGKTDVDAAFERAFPIVITKMSFKLERTTTVYNIEARLLNEQVAYGLKRGVIPKSIAISADTVENALGAKKVSAATQSVSSLSRTNADILTTIQNKNASNGLIDALNNLQTVELTNPSKGEAKQKIPDKYSIVIDSDSKVGSALIVDKDFYSKYYAPTVPVTNVNQVNDRTAYFKRAKIEKQKRIINLAPGTSILSAIDQIIGQSTYIRDAMVYFDEEKLQPTNTNDSLVADTANGQNQQSKDFEWYIVRPLVKIIDYDFSKNDYAYDVTYVIQKYRVPYIRSLMLQYQTGYHGPHKIYQYWYTGENTEVLSYEVNYNLLYFNTRILSTEGGIVESNDTAPVGILPSTDSSPAGKLPGSLELQNTVKTYLYSPSEQIKANIKILGDPDFIMPVESGSLSDMLAKWYGPSFSINANTGQVFIEIGFNEVIDYSKSTGLLEPKNNIKFWNYPEDIEAQTKGRMVYMVTNVTSRLSNGVFTQDLKTVIPNFALKTPLNKSREKTSNLEQTRADVLATIQKDAVVVQTKTNNLTPSNSTQGNNRTADDDSGR